ncbi:hypothetical protein VA7868_03124 [Vibrio aerogenes CECT 7868]|uniref:Uncharacterized protein n=1 Tax=Vibrio aerogenes CECT 7868 TaxID=1216006 RepID=A0A1M5ZSV9_9VIBR|nr:hypothetical protein [Vibrio aerogenes]SHI27013.1 hypothetical protein VA7868_03124 [Vibrio aerogenes CECT 7868]
MVNNKINISAFKQQPPADVGESRLYLNGPLYPKEKVLEILDAGDHHTRLWTRKCIRDVANLALEMDEVRLLIRQAIILGTYISSEWCVQKPNGPCAACDGYRLYRNEWAEYARKTIRFEYYVKFAVTRNEKILLLVSCHPSQ